jgi:hypothetical protein
VTTTFGRKTLFFVVYYRLKRDTCMTMGSQISLAVLASNAVQFIKFKHEPIKEIHLHN